MQRNMQQGIGNKYVFFCRRETNLKVKQCLDKTNALGEDEKSLSQFNGHIICEPPNNNLSKFDGTLTWAGQKYGLDNEKV